MRQPGTTARLRRLAGGVVLLGVGFVVGVQVGRTRGIPFVETGEQWSIGIFRSDSPLRFSPRQAWFNPRFSAEAVTDLPARFVADPFLVKGDDLWYLFFEVYNNRTAQGDLAVATSRSLRSWDYAGVVLDEPFHLSYPYVFESEGSYYMIPESFETNSVRLYRADDFPSRWSFVTTLVEGRDYVDNSIVFHDGRWWLFSSVTSNDTLYLHSADSLTGPWTEHPESPIVTDDLHRSRPSGRITEYQGRLYRYTMDVAPPQGTHRVMAYEITELTPTRYAERSAQDEPVLAPSGRGWNGQGMHQIDPVRVGPDEWVAAVDGFGKYRVFGWRY
ncbi:MAG: hypothetical protein P8188_14965 [Gemmatimonadota bacterium]